MTLLLILACIPIGFVWGDLLITLKMVSRRLSGRGFDDIPQRAPNWMVDSATVLALALLAITYPGMQ